MSMQVIFNEIDEYFFQINQTGMNDCHQFTNFAREIVSKQFDLQDS